MTLRTLKQSVGLQLVDGVRYGDGARSMFRHCGVVLQRGAEKIWTFGVPNDLFCLSVGSTIIADCEVAPSGEAKAFIDGQRSGAS